MSQDTVVAPFRRCSALGRLDIPCTAAAAFVIETAAGNASFSCADIAHQSRSGKADTVARVVRDLRTGEAQAR